MSCCIVLGFSDRKRGEYPLVEDPHITIAYLGEEDLEHKDFMSLVDSVHLLATRIPKEVISRVLRQSYFGDYNDIPVYEVTGSGPRHIRQELIDILDSTAPHLSHLVEFASQHSYTPHLTYPHDIFPVGKVIACDTIEIWNGDDTVVFDIPQDSLMHYGILRRSGRYPWGSGENPHQRSRSFMGYVDDLKKQGLSEKQIAQALGIESTTDLRAMRTIARHEIKAAQISQARMLKEKNMSNMAIAKKMGLNESSVRDLLKPSAQAKQDVLISVRDKIKSRMDEIDHLDIGKGVNVDLGISEVRLNTVISMLKEEGYVVHNNVQVPTNVKGQNISMKVLSKPGTNFSDVIQNRDAIRTLNAYSEDNGHTFLDIQPPKSISSKRVKVVYGEEGGGDEDGVIYLRPGVKDLSLGKSSYAQVRIAVDGTHYLKGMALYKDDMPPGVDILYNTPKSKSIAKHDVFKKMADDPDNPFGSTIKRQSGYINIVNEEGKWRDWSNTIASQVLSKQRPEVAKEQLSKFYNQKKEAYDEISSLTNPVIKKRLLEALADDLDSSAVDLKGAALPRQSTNVILPVKTMKETEIFAPNYRNGEKVVLIRYPHGGIFEIPELTVNNKHKDAVKNIGLNARDAVGISPKTAAKLSGADFDGDTVLVIPNNNGKIKTHKALKGLQDFDPKTAYPKYPGMEVISGPKKQDQMGIVSNLINDMTIKGADFSEIARAVRHSMVIIDAEKHQLNYKQSEIDNGIKELHKKYQGRSTGGASTLLSRASSPVNVPHRRLRNASEGGPYDPKTGKKVYVETGETYFTGVSKTTGKKIIVQEGKDYRIDKKTGQKEYVDPKTIKENLRTIKSKKMAEVDDARKLSSGLPMEEIYADHANKLKALANQARKDFLATPPLRYSPEAKKKYEAEVSSLNARLNMINKDKPLRRQARIIANTTYKQKLLENPEMDDERKKKVKAQAFNAARKRLGLKDEQIYISDREWEAIQAGAISNQKLTDIIKVADLDRVRELATPIKKPKMTATNISRAKSMKANGYSRGEIADALGVSISTLDAALLD